MKAYVFPGQGAQFEGMGKNLYESSETAKVLFEKANDVLGFRISDVMFDGSAEDLRQTRITQPAIFIHSIVSAQMAGADFQPDLVAGHSLGEFSALVAARALTFEEGLSLVYAAEMPNSHSPRGRLPQIVSFNRQELTMLLNVYGRRVASGEWRDYAMDMLKDRAFFSIYRRTSERPQFVIEKNPKLRNRQGQYVVTNHEGRVLRRGHELERVLRVLEPGFTVIK